LETWKVFYLQSQSSLSYILFKLTYPVVQTFQVLETWKVFYLQSSGAHFHNLFNLPFRFIKPVRFWKPYRFTCLEVYLPGWLLSSTFQSI